MLLLLRRCSAFAAAASAALLPMRFCICVLFLFAMSSDSSEPGCEGVQEDQALDSDLDGSSPSRDQDPLALPRRSPRLVQRQLLDWPVVRILEVLYANGISAPPGLGHEDLLELLVSRVPAALEDPEPDLAASRKKKGQSSG